MAKLIQNNFSGGVLSPSLYGRSDLQSYYKGCARAENFVVAKEGSLRKRHGLTSRLELDDYAEKKIVPYLYDRTVSGFLLLAKNGDGLDVKYYSKGGTLKSSLAISSFSGKVGDIQSKQVGDQLWISNGSFFRIITVKDAATISESAWSRASVPSSVSSISAAGFKADDTAYNPTSGRTITYGAYVSRDGVLSAIKTVNFTWSTSWVAGYYINVTVKIPSSLQYDYILLGKKSGSLFGEVSRWYPEDVTNNQVVFKDENHVGGDAIYRQTDVLGDGFSKPRCVDCFQQRRVFANAAVKSGSLPMTLWFSEVGNLDNFYANRPADDSDPFSPTISSTGPSFIRWIVSYQEMMVLFTDSGLFSVGFSQQSGFSASSCRISRFSNLSVSPDVQPVVTDAGIVFVASDNKTLYTASYDLQENMLKPVNRSVLVEHLTRKSQIKAVALQTSPDNVVWVVTDDGRMATFTFERNEEVYAWSESAIDGAKALDVISLGSVTDSSTDRTYGDLVFVVEKGGKTYIATPNGGYADEIGGETRAVRATLTTLPPESQERTIAGLKKNVKDILLKLYETGGISVIPADSGRGVELVDAKINPSGGLYTGNIKVMPRGVVSPMGQVTYVSDNDLPCEVLQIVTEVEVS